VIAKKFVAHMFSHFPVSLRPPGAHYHVNVDACGAVCVKGLAEPWLEWMRHTYKHDRNTHLRACVDAAAPHATHQGWE